MISATVFLLMCFVGALALQSFFWPHVTDVERWGWTFTVYGLAYALLWVLLSSFVWRLWPVVSGRVADSEHERGVGGRRFGHVALGIIFVAVLARVVTVYATEPVLSDDIWRYIHDGETLLAGDNPYAVAPADELSFDPATNRINHPELVTIYQPVSQYVFGALAYVSGRTGAPVRVYRLGFVLFDVAVVGLLLWQLHREGRSPWWAVLYGWHPLAVSEVAGSGHQDVIGMALLAGALVMVSAAVGGGEAYPRDSLRLSRGLGDGGGRAGKLRGGGGVVMGAVLLALAGAVKPIVLPIALLAGWRLRRVSWGWALLFVAVMGVVLAAVYLPFMLMEGGLHGMFRDRAHVRQ